MMKQLKKQEKRRRQRRKEEEQEIEKKSTETVEERWKEKIKERRRRRKGSIKNTAKKRAEFQRWKRWLENRDAKHKALTTDKQETRQSRIHATRGGGRMEKEAEEVSETTRD